MMNIIEWKSFLPIWPEFARQARPVEARFINFRMSTFVRLFYSGDSPSPSSTFRLENSKGNHRCRLFPPRFFKPSRSSSRRAKQIPFPSLFPLSSNWFAFPFLLLFLFSYTTRAIGQDRMYWSCRIALLTCPIDTVHRNTCVYTTCIHMLLGTNHN